jgi:hypothetical protein
VVQGSIIVLLASKWIFAEFEKFRAGKATIGRSVFTGKQSTINANAVWKSAEEIKGKAE